MRKALSAVSATLLALAGVLWLQPPPNQTRFGVRGVAATETGGRSQTGANLGPRHDFKSGQPARHDSPSLAVASGSDLLPPTHTNRLQLSLRGAEQLRPTSIGAPLFPTGPPLGR